MDRICPVCKNICEPQEKFCSECGCALPEEPRQQTEDAAAAVRAPRQKTEKAPKTPKKLPWRYIIPWGLAAILLCCFVVSVSWKPAESRDFSTPEAAAKYFARCVKNGDSQAALLAFSSNYKADNLDYSAYLDSAGYFAAGSQPSPSDGGYYSELNRDYFAREAANQLKLYSYSLLLPENYLKGAAMQLTAPNMLSSQYGEALDSTALSQLKLVRVDCVDSLPISAGKASQLTALCGVYGYTEVSEYAALWKLGDKYFAGGFTFALHDGRWQIESLTCRVCDGVEKGALTVTTKSDYRELIAG